MNNLNIISNLSKVLETAEVDPAVGIRVSYLTGGDDFSIFGAEIAPYKKVGAHYHESGHEIYQIIEGSGVMHIGLPNAGGDVNWTKSLQVKTGDCFTVNEGEVHQLINDSADKLVAVFCCPKSHLSTDRIIVDGFSAD